MSISFLLFLSNLFIALSFGRKEKINKNLKNLNKEFATLRKLTIQEGVLIGFDNFKKKKNIIMFDTYYFFDDILKIEGAFNMSLTIVPENSLRNLDDDINAICRLRSIDPLYIYNCTAIYPKNISSIKFKDEDYNGTISSLAEASKNSIQNAKKGLLSKALVFKNLTNSKIVQQSGTSFEIRGDGLTKDDSSNNIKLVAFNNGGRQEFSCNGNTEGEDYSLQCTSYRTINADLNNSIGYFGNNKSILFEVQFPEESNSTIEFYDYDKNRNKKSSGMSTGGIIAITIPCIILLLGIVGITFFLQNKNTNPPLKDMINKNNNNTVGIAGANSSQVVVKQ